LLSEIPLVVWTSNISQLHANSRRKEKERAAEDDGPSPTDIKWKEKEGE